MQYPFQTTLGYAITLMTDFYGEISSDLKLSLIFICKLIMSDHQWLNHLHELLFTFCCFLLVLSSLQ